MIRSSMVEEIRKRVVSGVSKLKSENRLLSILAIPRETNRYFTHNLFKPVLIQSKTTAVTPAGDKLNRVKY
jgi:hypothetical protein